jgi:hypothetical protein
MTWDALAEVRRKGMKPLLPVYVTDRWMLAKNMRDVGCISILHKPGKPMPVRLLDGLDVRLDVGTCERAGRVKRLMDQRDVKPATMRAWCQCAGEFVALCVECEKGDESWLER